MGDMRIPAHYCRDIRQAQPQNSPAISLEPQDNQQQPLEIQPNQLVIKDRKTGKITHVCSPEE